MNIPTYAVIPTANRPDVALDAIDSIIDQVDDIFVIDNGMRMEMPSSGGHREGHYFTTFWRPDPFSLYRIWNFGIRLARNRAPEGRPYNIAVINDDAIVPPGWVETVSGIMRTVGAAAGCSGLELVAPIIHSKAEPVSLFTRMTGWAFILQGESGLEANERYTWWFGDDDLDWRARQAGGMVRIPGLRVENRFENGQMTPELQAAAHLDGLTFKQIWGQMPW